MARAKRTQVKKRDPIEEIEEHVAEGEDQPEREAAIEILRNAAEQKVRIHSNKIASSLLKGTLAGNANSAKMLVSLVDGNRAKPKRRTGPTVAEQMAADEPWVDETGGKSVDKVIDAEEP
jgi:hypothetical protein